MGRNWFADLWADTAAGKFAQQDLAILVTTAGVVSRRRWLPEIESRLWSMEDVVALIDEHAERTAPRLADRLVG